jgi:hypothetical protein
MRGWIRKAVLGAGAGALVLAGAPAAGADDGMQRIELRDECDAASFNAVLGPGACDPRYGGDVTFDELVEELTEDPRDVLADRDAKGWRSTPRDAEVDRGERLALRSRGGEAHSFTRVARFGPGCVEELNDLLGLTGLHPVCSVDRNGDRVPDWVTGIVEPGGSRTLPALTRGTHRFECMIHPWMRTTLRVE